MRFLDPNTEAEDAFLPWKHGARRSAEINRVVTGSVYEGRLHQWQVVPHSAFATK